MLSFVVEILSCSAISWHPYYHMTRLFLLIEDYRTRYISGALARKVRAAEHHKKIW